MLSLAGMVLQVQHGAQLAARLAQAFGVHQVHRGTGRPHVLLGAAVDQREVASRSPGRLKMSLLMSQTTGTGLFGNCLNCVPKMVLLLVKWK
jgi:hypothetical protein